VNSSLSPRIAEQRAIEVAESYPGTTIFCTTLGRGQLALYLAKARSNAQVHCWFIDQYQWQKAIDYSRETEDQELLQRLHFECQPDPSEQTVDLAIVPLMTGGEAELSRETLQLMHQRLSVGGTLITAVDNPRDQWLHQQMKELFAKVTVKSFPDAMVYVAVKTTELKRVRNFECEFAFRDREKLIYAISRPGVFSHRHIDPGARQLIDTIEMGPKSRVIDIGCGAGTVSLALAARDSTTVLHAVDGNARAVQCTEAGAKRNGLSNITAELNSFGTKSAAASFDLAVANPPYFADFRIAEHFVETAMYALKPGGQLLLVTKQPSWYEEFLPDKWDDVDIWPSKRYHLVAAVKP